MASPIRHPGRDNAMVTFDLDVEKGELERSNSNIDLRKFNSEAPTLNNTPNVSRNPSPVRRKSSNRGHSSPTQHDLNVMGYKHNIATISRYSNDELEISWLGAVIIACFFTSGLIDAVAFNSWNCFVGMQTGNTIFGALGLGGLPATAHEHQYIKSFVAIGAFMVGTLFFNLIHRLPTGLHNQPTSRKRAVFVLSFFTQTILIVVAAALVTADLVSNRSFVVGTFSSGVSDEGEVDESRKDWIDLLPIVLLSFQAAGQVCLSRVLGLIELPTIVLSTLYHDWTADLYGTRQLWKNSSSLTDFVFGQGRRQNKRLASIIALFLGGIVGGEMYKTDPGMAGALWLAVGIKSGITLAFCIWRKQSDDMAGSDK